MIWHGFKSGGADARMGASCNTAYSIPPRVEKIKIFHDH
jgi:hypothetical protein